MIASVIKCFGPQVIETLNLQTSPSKTEMRQLFKLHKQALAQKEMPNTTSEEHNARPTDESPPPLPPQVLHAPIPTRRRKSFYLPSAEQAITHDELRMLLK